MLPTSSQPPSGFLARKSVTIARAAARSTPGASAGLDSGRDRHSAYEAARSIAAAARSGDGTTVKRAPPIRLISDGTGSPKMQAMIGFALSRATRSISSSACSRVNEMSGVTTAIAASISSAARATRNPVLRSAPPPTAVVSMGLATALAGLSDSRRICCVASPSSGTTRPVVVQASAARMSGPPELPTRATRRPFGSGAAPSSAMTSRSSSSPPTAMTPAAESRASDATVGVAAAAVCDRAPRTPATVLPAFRATIGFLRATRRAIRKNFLGLPNDSR